MKGERKTGKTIYRVEFLIHCNAEVMKCKAEMCFHMQRPSSSYDFLIFILITWEGSWDLSFSVYSWRTIFRTHFVFL